MDRPQPRCGFRFWSTTTSGSGFPGVSGRPAAAAAFETGVRIGVGGIQVESGLLMIMGLGRPRASGRSGGGFLAWGVGGDGGTLRRGGGGEGEEEAVFEVVLGEVGAGAGVGDFGSGGARRGSGLVEGWVRVRCVWLVLGGEVVGYGH